MIFTKMKERWLLLLFQKQPPSSSSHFDHLIFQMIQSQLYILSSIFMIQSINDVANWQFYQEDDSLTCPEYLQSSNQSIATNQTEILLSMIYNKSIIEMLGKFSLYLLLATMAFSASIPCTQYQSSKNGNASDCSITRVDSLTISWGAKINFNVNYNWNSKSYANVLADMGSPKLPISPSKSSCESKAGAYTKGQSVLINCTQSFSSIPVGYSNVITAFDGDDYPLGFSTKIPLSSHQANLQQQ